ncbi:MAG: hypothetical protein MJE68_20345, partial [Proteobacteria bacterium]|nr:hypothetical protein [Pseudomonadota bacterium]
YRGDIQGEAYFATVDSLATNPLSLAEHIFQQIGLLIPEGDLRAVACALVEYVTPHGWLDGEAKQAAAELGVAGTAFDDLLARLQCMEPSGLFARNLAECLSLQLKDQGDYTPFMAKLIAHLPVLLDGGGGVSGLADAIGASADEVATALHRLRRLDPKPGSRFTHHHSQGDIYHPDIIVKQDEAGGDFVVAVNRANLPEVRVVDTGEAKTELGQEANRVLLAAACQEVKAMEGRGRMLLGLAELATHRQAAFIRRGSGALLALTMAEAADALGYHPSSITRLVKDKLVLTPRGLLPFADFFSPASVSHKNQPASQQQPIASKAVTALIIAMLAEEDKTAPMSDRVLAARLAKTHGVHLSRRAIAKRRAMGHIAPYPMRVRVAPKASRADV